MFDPTSSVPRQPLVRGLLSALLVGVVLLCSICHVESASAATASDPGSHTAGPLVETAGPQNDAAHEHAESRHCDDGGAVGADLRSGGAAKLLALLALGLALVAAVWLAPPKADVPRRLLTRVALPRPGTRLLLTLCVIRV
ncbi:hypothetical protein [Marinactinospora rubrisoli]|uniref:Uncharacterized protein n=1 Tax=Marinactinospora rubrisoli TaxID=2715399 RepID=A0ABW2KIL3_9ACTN